MSHEAQLATWELKKSQVNPREKFFLLSLARRAGEDHTCWPSIARMVEDTGFDRKTLIDVRQGLISRSMISYTGRMVGRSGQIPEMRLDYVQKWEELRNSPRLHDEHETVDKLHLTSPKTGTGTSTETGTGTSPKNGTLNKSLENKNRNKSFCLSDEQKKHKAVNNKESWREANQKKHSWAEKAKESPRADVTSQSTSFNREEHQSIQHSPEAVQKAMMSLPRHMRPKRYRDANPDDDKTKATELPTGTAVQPEVSTRSEPDEQGASVDVDGKQIDSPPVRGSNRLMETRRVHTFLEKAGMACAN